MVRLMNMAVESNSEISKSKSTKYFNIWKPTETWERVTNVEDENNGYEVSKGQHKTEVLAEKTRQRKYTKNLLYNKKT